VREFTELVADHFFGDRHRHMLVAVVDAEGQADDCGSMVERRPPDLDDVRAAGPARDVAFFQQIAVDERPLPDRSASWRSSLLLRTCREATMNLSVALFERVFLPLSACPTARLGDGRPRCGFDYIRILSAPSAPTTTENTDQNADENADDDQPASSAPPHPPPAAAVSGPTRPPLGVVLLEGGFPSDPQGFERAWR